MIMTEIKEKKEVSVLDAVYHQRLIEELPHIVELSRIPAKAIKCSMKGVCSDQEIEWVKGYHTHEGRGGLCLTGNNSALSQQRIFAIGAALIRNFIDARSYDVSELTQGLEDGDLPWPTVMLVPNFYIACYGKAFPAWKVQRLHGMLMSRLTSDKKTVLYVESFDSLITDYGMAISDLIKTNWDVVDN
jgi:hypothetical protein